MEEDVIYWFKVIEVALIAGIKFALAPFEAERQGFNFREALAITVLGGIAGVIAFSVAGEIIAFGWNKLVDVFRKIFQYQRDENPKTSGPRRKFTWLTRLVVRVRSRFGIAGIAIITPSIISIPVGSIMIHRFYRNKLKNIFLLSVSILAWALLLNGLAQYLQLSQYLPE